MRVPWKLVSVAATMTAAYFAAFGTGSTLVRHPRAVVAHRTGDAGKKLHGLVIGATGATGTQVLQQLLASARWEKVTSIGRRSVGDELLSEVADRSKLVEVQVESMWELASTEDAWANVDAVFLCVGATRKSAGSAEAFIAIEVGISRAVAAMAGRAGVSHISVVSAQGCNADWPFAPHWPAVLHPLLYVQTLGRKERAVLAQLEQSNGGSLPGKGIRSASLFRPGMLDRRRNDRVWERLLGQWGGFHVLNALKVDVLARAMVRDAEAAAAGGWQGAEEPVVYEGNGLIRSAAGLNWRLDE
jgi:nucleoside-diphosphate-sugar epimerase